MRNKGFEKKMCLARWLFAILALILTYLAGVSPCGAQEKNEQINLELNGFYTRGNYSVGTSSDSYATFMTLLFPKEARAWAGYNRVKYNAVSGLYAGGYEQRIYCVGGYFHLGKADSVQIDCFQMRDSLGSSTDIYGAEYFHKLSPNFFGGLSFFNSSYPGYTVRQYTPRLIIYPTRKITLNSKIYITQTSDDRSGIAFQQKITAELGRHLKGNAGVATGRRINAVDNDITGFYTQVNDLKGTFYASIEFLPCEWGKIVAGYEHDVFEGYTIDYYTAGVRVRF